MAEGNEMPSRVARRLSFGKSLEQDKQAATGVTSGNAVDSRNRKQRGSGKSRSSTTQHGDGISKPESRVLQSPPTSSPGKRKGKEIEGRSATWQLEDAPEEYIELLRSYNAMEAACGLLRRRSTRCTWEKLAPLVEGVTRKRFTRSHVAKMKFVLPEAISLEIIVCDSDQGLPVRVGSGSPSEMKFGRTRRELRIELLPAKEGGDYGLAGYATAGKDNEGDGKGAQELRAASDDEEIMKRKAEFTRRLEMISRSECGRGGVPEAPLPSTAATAAAAAAAADDGAAATRMQQHATLGRRNAAGGSAAPSSSQAMAITGDSHLGQGVRGSGSHRGHALTSTAGSNSEAKDGFRSTSPSHAKRPRFVEREAGAAAGENAASSRRSLQFGGDEDDEEGRAREEGGADASADDFSVSLAAGSAAKRAGGEGDSKKKVAELAGESSRGSRDLPEPKASSSGLGVECARGERERQREAARMLLLDDDDGLRADGASDGDNSDEEILRSLPQEVVELVKRREAFLKHESSEHVKRERRRKLLIASLPPVVDLIIALCLTTKKSTFSEVELVSKVVAKNRTETNERETAEQLVLLSELVPDWLMTKKSMKGDQLYMVQMKAAPAAEVKRRITSKI